MNEIIINMLLLLIGIGVGIHLEKYFGSKENKNE